MEPRFAKHDVAWTDEAVANLWDHYGATLRPENYFSCHSGSFVLRRLRRHIPDGAAILDFGCGQGHLVRHLLATFPRARVFAVDFSGESVRVTNAAHDGTPGFQGATRAEGFPLPLAPGSMDVVLAVEVIEHLSEERLAAMLAEASRLLRPGGRLIVTTPNAEDLSAGRILCPECGCLFHQWQHVASWNVRTLGDRLARAGFEPVDVRACHFRSWSSAITAGVLHFLARLAGRSPGPDLPHLYAVVRKHG